MVESLMVESLVCSRAVIRVAETAVAAALGAETAAAAATAAVLIVATAAAVHLAGTAAAGPSFLVAAVAALLPLYLRWQWNPGSPTALLAKKEIPDESIVAVGGGIPLIRVSSFVQCWSVSCAMRLLASILHCAHVSTECSHVVTESSTVFGYSTDTVHQFRLVMCKKEDHVTA